MREDVKESFAEKMSLVPNEKLFNDIPSKIGIFHLYDGGERKPLIGYLGLIKKELFSRSNRYGEEYLLNSLSFDFCTDKLFPRWIDAFEAGGLAVFDVLEEVGLLNIVVKQLSTVLKCELDINSVITELYKKSILLGNNFNGVDLVDEDVQVDVGSEVHIDRALDG